MGWRDIFSAPTGQAGVRTYQGKLDAALGTSGEKQQRLASNLRSRIVYQIENDVWGGLDNASTSSKWDLKLYGQYLQLLRSGAYDFSDPGAKSGFVKTYLEHLIRFLRDGHKLPEEVWRHYLPHEAYHDHRMLLSVDLHFLINSARETLISSAGR